MQWVGYVPTLLCDDFFYKTEFQYLYLFSKQSPAQLKITKFHTLPIIWFLMILVIKGII
jgi:hypothetical protein